MIKERKNQRSDGWDVNGIAAICSASLVRDRVRLLFRPERITSLEMVYDHCLLRLRSGRRYEARLGRDGNIVLEEVN